MCADSEGKTSEDKSPEDPDGSLEEFSALFLWLWRQELEVSSGSFRKTQNFLKEPEDFSYCQTEWQSSSY